MKVIYQKQADNVADRIKFDETGKGRKGGTFVEMRRYMFALAAHIMTLIEPNARRLKRHASNERPMHAACPSFVTASVGHGDAAADGGVARLQEELAYEGSQRTRISSRTEFEAAMAEAEVKLPDTGEVTRILAQTDPKWGGWVNVAQAELAYRVQVAPLLANDLAGVNRTVALLKTQLAQALYDAERWRRAKAGAAFPATAALCNGFASWVYEHEGAVCVEDVPHKIRSVIMQICKQAKGDYDVLISKWRLLEVVEAEIARTGEDSQLREVKQILDGHYDDQHAKSAEWFFFCPALRAELRAAGYWRDAAALQVTYVACRMCLGLHICAHA